MEQLKREFIEMFGKIKNYLILAKNFFIKYIKWFILLVILVCFVLFALKVFDSYKKTLPNRKLNLSNFVYYLNYKFEHNNFLVSVRGRLFGRTETVYGVKGTKGWLFYKCDGCVDTAQNKVIYKKSDVKMLDEKLKKLKQFCFENEIKLVITFAPLKSTVYSEYYPASYKKIHKHSKLEQLESYYADNSEISFVFPTKTLLAMKNQTLTPLYYKTDSQWTPDGTYIVYNMIIEEIKKNFPYISAFDKDLIGHTQVSFLDKFNTPGDAQRALNISNDAVTDTEYNIYKTTGDEEQKSDLRVYFIGDAYGIGIENWLDTTFISPVFKRYDKEKTFDFNAQKNAIIDNGTQILILEFSEANLDKFVNMKI